MDVIWIGFLGLFFLVMGLFIDLCAWLADRGNS
jgi:hypothetical protein